MAPYVGRIPTPIAALDKVKAKVFKQRIRLKDFFIDFDKLRSGYITQAQFKSCLTMAGLNLTAEELEVLAVGYANPEDPTLRVHYTQFVLDVDYVFGKRNLEKDPLMETFDVDCPPDSNNNPLIDPKRFEHAPERDLGPEDEYKLAILLDKLKYDYRTRRITVKPFFEEYAKNVNSARLVNHVTTRQFRQAMKCHLGPGLSQAEVDLLIAKYRGDDDYPDMVNYVALGYVVDPPEPKYDVYSLKPI